MSAGGQGIGPETRGIGSGEAGGEMKIYSPPTWFPGKNGLWVNRESLTESGTGIQ